MRKLVSSTLACVVVLLVVDRLEAQEAPALPANIESTLDLYLSADDAYQAGDLITQSQLKEFQVYLRRTRGSSLATHQKWAKKALGDRAGLSQLFYNGGAEILREVAQKKGGFAELDELVSTPRGKAIVQKAIKQKDVDQILLAIEQHENERKQRLSQKNSQEAPQPAMKLKIYTAENYLNALKEAVASRQKAASPDKRVPVISKKPTQAP